MRFRSSLLATCQRGFTLVELMVTIAVAAVFMMLAAPVTSRFVSSNLMTTQANELIASLNLARSEAVKLATPVALRTASAGNLEDFTPGWTIFQNAAADGNNGSGTNIRNFQLPIGKSTIKRVTNNNGSFTDADSGMADRMYIVFSAMGINNSGAAAYFRICDSHNPSMGGKIVQVSPTGRVSLLASNSPCS